MPIVEQAAKPGEPCYDPGQGPIPESAVKIQNEVFRGITIDFEYAPPSHMMLWSGGSNWLIDSYWSQILRPDQEPQRQNLKREPHAQQYRYLHGISLKVNQTLDSSADQVDNTWTRRGAGHTYGYMTPNVGDMFAAGIGGGRTGLFTITSSQRVTVQQGSTYAVEWLQVSELTEELLNDLKRKSIEEYWLSTASMTAGCGPWLDNEAQQRKQRYAHLLNVLAERYITEFFSVEHSTMVVKDQMWKTYDHFATKAFCAMVDTYTDRRMHRVKLLNVMSEPVMKQPTVWDAILRHDIYQLALCTERAHLVSTKISRWKPELQAIGYSGIPRMVFPIDSPVDVDSQYDGEDTARPWGIPYLSGKPLRPEQVHAHPHRGNDRNMPSYEMPEFWPPKTQLERDLPFFQRIPPEQEYLYENKRWAVPCDIHPVAIDDYYVFSEAFYRCDVKLQSKLEILATSMIKKEPLDLKMFDAMLENALYWDNLERYYYYPVIIALLKYAR